MMLGPFGRKYQLALLSAKLNKEQVKQIDIGLENDTIPNLLRLRLNIKTSGSACAVELEKSGSIHLYLWTIFPGG